LRCQQLVAPGGDRNALCGSSFSVATDWIAHEWIVAYPDDGLEIGAPRPKLERALGFTVIDCR
jgi:hypothetical protein